MLFDPALESGQIYNLSIEFNDASVDNQIFRKNVSKVKEFWSGGASIEIMPVYVPAQSTKGEKYTRSETDELVLCGTTCDDTSQNCETIVCGTDQYPFAKVKPLIVSYLQAEE